MNTGLFFTWLHRFDSFISRVVDRKVLMLIDNASAHCTRETVPILPNVEVIFLPPNTTAKFKLLAAGIVACLKQGYRNWQYDMAVDNLDSNRSKVHKVDQLTAMEIIRGV